MAKKTDRRPLDFVREMIHQNDDERAIQELCHIIGDQDGEAYDEAIVHQSRMNDIAQQERRGLLGAGDAQTERNRVRFAVLQLIDEVERRRPDLRRCEERRTVASSARPENQATAMPQEKPRAEARPPGEHERAHPAPSARRFDVFLSHNSRDKPAAKRLAEALKQRNLSVWLDDWELAPGRLWMDALEDIITTCGSAAVCVGKNGIGPWEEPEMRGLLQRFVEEKKTGHVVPVIPVLLPGAPGDVKLPLFLGAFTWVDLRDGLRKDGLDRLQWGITGVKPAE